jgi:hypothetical protein
MNSPRANISATFRFAGEDRPNRGHDPGARIPSGGGESGGARAQLALAANQLALYAPAVCTGTIAQRR